MIDSLHLQHPIAEPSCADMGGVCGRSCSSTKNGMMPSAVTAIAAHGHERSSLLTETAPPCMPSACDPAAFVPGFICMHTNNDWDTGNIVARR